MSIKIAYRKAKGRNLQKWVAQKISDLLGIPCGKDELIESREMGQCGTDIKLYGEAKERFNYSIECKAQESLSIPAWIKQAKENTVKGTDWLLICKKSRENPIVIMDAKVFFNLVSKTLK